MRLDKGLTSGTLGSNTSSAFQASFGPGRRSFALQFLIIPQEQKPAEAVFIPFSGPMQLGKQNRISDNNQIARDGYVFSLAPSSPSLGDKLYAKEAKKNMDPKKSYLLIIQGCQPPVGLGLPTARRHLEISCYS